MALLAHRRGWLLTAAVLTTLASLLVPGLVRAQSAQYAASLAGGNEIPPTSSTATGSFTATLDEGARTLTWSLSVPSINSVTMAHIHQGARDANGPIIVPLFMPSAPANSITASGTATAADLEGPLGGNWDGFVAALKTGGLYINVHTTAIPSGEIRGQVSPATQGGTARPTSTPTRVVTPSVPSTGHAGLLGASASSKVAALSVLVTVGVLAGGRVLTRRTD